MSMKINAGDLEVGELPDGSVPLAVIAGIRAMLPDGSIINTVLKSEELPLVEALGLVHFQRLQIEDAIRA